MRSPPWPRSCPAAASSAAVARSSAAAWWRASAAVASSRSPGPARARARNLLPRLRAEEDPGTA
eukprot:13249208-Alexandrium_andersonii.AAC.1